MSLEQPYKYKFSVIIPVYNVEKYIGEAIDSIINQTIGFEDNCELILVDDGSTDGSESVCLEYKERFPNNVIYIKQANAGPGAARSNGAAHARGKYISMPDSDDKLSLDTLEEVYKFMQAHYDEIDVVGIKWEFFEARTGGHPLNFKFTSDRIINLETEYESIQGSAAPAFFKKEVFDNHSFDPKVGRYAEDGRFMAEVLLDKKKYGVVTKPTYFYRKRADQTSSQDGNLKDKFWYLETPKRTWVDLFNYAKLKNDGKIPKFVQYQVMYDLQWRYKQRVQTVLNPSELKVYKNLLESLLQEIDDDVIVAQRQFGIFHKIFLLDKKHKENTLQKAIKSGNRYFYKGTDIYSSDVVEPAVHIETIDIVADKFIVEGYYSGFLLNDDKLLFSSKNNLYESESVNRVQHQIHFLDELITDQNCFKVSIPLKEAELITAKVEGKISLENLPFVMHRFAYLSDSAAWSYRRVKKWLISKTYKQLTVAKHTTLRNIRYELRYNLLLAKRLRIRPTVDRYKEWRSMKVKTLKSMTWVFIPLKSMLINVYVVLFRLVGMTARIFKRKEIWLIMDRVMGADDSGEIIFKYLQNNPDKSVRTYFVLSKKSSEYKPLKKYGKVLNYGSFRHKVLFLLSDKIISSEATDHIINVFGPQVQDLVDLYSFDFVFLQHGIIKDDISSWLNRYSKNIKMFVTSVRPEYESIINGNYGYDESVVKLTGLPRYDNLSNSPQGKLVIAPTWRENLAGKVDFKTSFREYNPHFKESEYYRFYQGLMDDERIIAALKKYDMIGEFYLHPSFQQQIKDFYGSDHFEIMDMPFDYPKMKREGSVLVSDFSSVAFDFGYLNKPVIYAHFDSDSFYKNHTSNEGYFSYEKDGFGPVVYNYEDTVRAIIDAIESGCKLNQKYKKRVNNFFAYNDQDNSKRVYKAIKEMNK